MAVVEKLETSPSFVNPERRAELIRISKEVNAKAGVTGEPTMTAQELRAMQRAHGVRAVDNGASRELMRMRYGDDYDQDED